MDIDEFMLVSLSSQNPFMCNITVNARSIPLARLDTTLSNAAHAQMHIPQNTCTHKCAQTHMHIVATMGSKMMRTC